MNEKTIGKVLKEWLDSGKIKREELFITTKLPPPANIPDYVEPTLRKSLEDLQLDYVDLYLVHVPFGVLLENGDFKRNENGEIVIEPTTDHLAVWKVGLLLNFNKSIKKLVVNLNNFFFRKWKKFKNWVWLKLLVYQISMRNKLNVFWIIVK